MSGHPEVVYTLDFGVRRQGKREGRATRQSCGLADGSIPRLARLLALAIRMEGLLRSGTIGDYAELARLGRVTRARMTQIMRLLNLAPDLQEQILFLPLIRGLNERNLRPITNRIDWDEPRRLFQDLARRSVVSRAVEYALMRPSPTRSCATASNVRPSPSILAFFPVSPCQRSTTTSAYLGSSSSP
jgi:hypothetical protein